MLSFASPGNLPGGLSRGLVRVDGLIWMWIICFGRESRQGNRGACGDFACGLCVNLERYTVLSTSPIDRVGSDVEEISHVFYLKYTKVFSARLRRFEYTRRCVQEGFFSFATFVTSCRRSRIWRSYPREIALDLDDVDLVGQVFRVTSSRACPGTAMP